MSQKYVKIEVRIEPKINKHYFLINDFMWLIA